MEEVEAQSLFHVSPRCVEWKTGLLSAPGSGAVQIKTLVSAISAGTEGLFFRGEIPSETPLDGTLTALSGRAIYPFRYGYCLVGVVEKIGDGVDPGWLGRRVFSFEPHTTKFNAPIERLHIVPDEIPSHRAVLFPLVETAVTLVLDASPRLGENVAVFGLGPLGTVVAKILSTFPMNTLHMIDPNPARVSRAVDWTGSGTSSLPAESSLDLAFDLGGLPASSAAAVASLGFGGRLLLGSWQGQDFSLPGRGVEFHRKRLEVICSQVSTIAPWLTARWSQERRSSHVWSVLQTMHVEELISHSEHFSRAQKVFEGLQQKMTDYFQVVLDYE